MENNFTELEVGCGWGQGGNGLAVGPEAARQAVAGTGAAAVPGEADNFP